MNSFARDVKSELARQRLKHACCMEEELRAFLEINGKLVLSAGQKTLVFQTENASVARRFFSLAKTCFDVTPEVLYGRHKKLQKNNVYFIQSIMDEEALSFLNRLGFLAGGNEMAAGRRRKKCCRRAYLRGAFLAGGSLNHPEREYHLEISFPAEAHVLQAQQVLKTFGLEARYFERKGHFVLYLKGGETIGEFLRIVQAHQGLLEYEKVRVVKGIRNRTNRLVNYETANLTRTAFAAHEQVKNIKTIQDTRGLETLPPSLRQAARLRLRFPEATLHELGSKASPPLSKSTVNHRMRRIKTLAQKAAAQTEPRDLPS